MLIHLEGIRYPSSRAQLEKLKTLKPDGRITAAISSQLCDGAAAVLICNERGLKRLGLTPSNFIISPLKSILIEA